MNVENSCWQFRHTCTYSSTSYSVRGALCISRRGETPCRSEQQKGVLVPVQVCRTAVHTMTSSWWLYCKRYVCILGDERDVQVKWRHKQSASRHIAPALSIATYWNTSAIATTQLSVESTVRETAMDTDMAVAAAYSKGEVFVTPPQQQKRPRQWPQQQWPQQQELAYVGV